MRVRIIVLLLIATEVLCSCGVFRNRSVSYYYAGEPVEESGYVPQGKVVEAWYPCSVKGPTQRRMIVYLPPDYDENDRPYPVIYLLHGARGHETVWIQRGQMFQVTDSLYNLGKTVPAIVVMPNVNQYNDDKDFENSRYKDAMESLFEIDGTVETGFVKDVVGYVDSHFRTIPERRTAPSADCRSVPCRVCIYPPTPPTPSITSACSPLSGKSSSIPVRTTASISVSRKNGRSSSPPTRPRAIM